MNTLLHAVVYQRWDGLDEWCAHPLLLRTEKAADTHVVAPLLETQLTH